MSSIFISIASYKDPELSGTIRSLIENSSSTNELRIVALVQADHKELRRLQQAECASHADLRLINVSGQENQGECWARAEIQQLYNGEDYDLQLDSHVQFTKGWDRL